MRGGGGPLRGLVGDDDLEQRHLGHRREVVHADHPFGVACLGRNLGDRQGGGVGGEDRVLADPFLALGQHPPFEIEVFEDRLDDQVGALDVVDAGGEQKP